MKQSWISVDKSPKVCDRYLVYAKEHVHIARYESGAWELNNFNRAYATSITHWMPLPPAPTAKKKATKHTRTCRACGEKFETTHHNKLYCNSNCRERAKSGRDKEDYKKRKKEREKPKKSKMQSLNEVIEAAKNAGVSYGQYQAMKG